MYTVFDIANWYLQNVPDVNNKKLQKLVYYAYAWHLAISNDSVETLDSRLFVNEFEAWVHGAVTSSLYNAYKDNDSAIITKPQGVHLPNFSADEIDILQQVATIYGKYNGNELELINQQEDPWRNARRNLTQYEPSHNAITDAAIYEYYSVQLTDV